MIKMTRQEHLQWCKDRANVYLDNGDTTQAYASFGSDMNKHPDTEKHSAIAMGIQLMMIGALSTITEMRKFINDFN